LTALVANRSAVLALVNGLADLATEGTALKMGFSAAMRDAILI